MRMRLCVCVCVCVCVCRAYLYLPNFAIPKRPAAKPEVEETLRGAEKAQKTYTKLEFFFSSGGDETLGTVSLNSIPNTRPCTRCSDYFYD